jgi:hypothetical protein
MDTDAMTANHAKHAKTLTAENEGNAKQKPLTRIDTNSNALKAQRKLAQDWRNTTTLGSRPTK